MVENKRGGKKQIKRKTKKTTKKGGSKLEFGEYNFKEYQPDPKPSRNAGLFTGEKFVKGAPWANVPVKPNADYMMSKNLKSANPPPGAKTHFPHTLRKGNNLAKLPGVKNYENPDAFNRGPFRTNCSPKTEMTTPSNVPSGNKSIKTAQTNEIKRGGKGNNPWLDHVKKTKKENPKLKFKDVLIEAKGSYKKISKPVVKVVNKAVKKVKKVTKPVTNTVAKTMKKATKSKVKKETKQGSKGKKENPWLTHVKDTMKKNQGMEFHQVLKAAKKTYKK